MAETCPLLHETCKPVSTAGTLPLSEPRQLRQCARLLLIEHENSKNSNEQCTNEEREQRGL